MAKVINVADARVNKLLKENAPILESFKRLKESGVNQFIFIGKGPKKPSLCCTHEERKKIKKAKSCVVRENKAFFIEEPTAQKGKEKTDDYSN